VDHQRAGIAHIGEVREQRQRLDEGLTTAPQPLGRRRLAKAWVRASQGVESGAAHLAIGASSG
jgi:hypothetical protein